MWFIALFAVCGCSKDKQPESPPPAPVPAEQPGAAVPVDREPVDQEPADGEPVDPAVAVPSTPQGWYAQCEERVEGPGTDGECTTDADCRATGCSNEVCVPAAMGELTTTCEIAPCFKVLDTCGCRDGQCSWTLKAELPAGLKALSEAVAPTDVR